MDPPLKPMGQMSNGGAVIPRIVISSPAGTEAPAHSAPQPCIVIVLSGEGEGVASDGGARPFRHGEELFCNDLSGKGPVTRAH